MTKHHEHSSGAKPSTHVEGGHNHEHTETHLASTEELAEATGESPIHAQAAHLLTTTNEGATAHTGHSGRAKGSGADVGSIARASGENDQLVFTPLNLDSAAGGRGSKGFLSVAALNLPGFSTDGGGGGGSTDATAAPGSGSGAGKDKPGHLDATKSVSDLIKSSSSPGSSSDVKFEDKQSAVNDQAQQGNVLKQGQVPKIEVQYQNQDANAPSSLPDFIVKKDGTVQVLHDPEKNPDAQIVVQVQRDKGETDNPTAQQQQALDELVPYLAQRVANDASYNQLSGGKVDVDDRQHLVSDTTEQSIANDVSHPPPPAQGNPLVPPVPTDVGNVSGRMGRVQGSNGGHESFAPGAGGTVPERQVPPAQDNTPPVQAVEDTVSALSATPKQHPYEYVAHRSDGSYGVGRYAMSFGNFAGWLAELLGVDLGNPPDYSKLSQYLKDDPQAMQQLQGKMQELAKDGKVSQQFADQFKNPQFENQFVNTIGKLQGNDGPVSAADVKQFLPKDLQETVAQDRVQNYAHAMGINTDQMQDTDPGKLALAMYLGRVPTQSELSDPRNQNYLQTADNIYKLARAGQFTSGDVDVSEKNGNLIATARGDIGKQLWAETEWANSCQGGNLGCAASISKILEQAGVLGPTQGSASVEGLADILQSKGWQKIPITDKSQYRPGDVVYGLKGAHGHIGMIGEVTNGQVWEYDNSSSSTTLQHRTIEQGGSFVPIDNGRSRFGNSLYVLRPPGQAA